MKDKLLFNMVNCAIFIALTYVGTFVNINLGVVGMLHLGNFVAILASLLFGGLVGAISGSIGMGLFDITKGYPFTTVLRTFIVKFVVCYVLGILFQLLINKEKRKHFLEIVLACLFFTLGTVSLLLYIINPSFLEQNNIKTVLLLIGAILMYVFTIGFIILYIFRNKFNERENCVIVATSIGIIINIVLEFILRSLFVSLLGDYSFQDAIILSTIKIPASTINGIITILMVGFLYYPIYTATRNLIKK